MRWSDCVYRVFRDLLAYVDRSSQPPLSALPPPRTQVTFDNVAGNYIWVAEVDPGNMTVAPAGLAFDRALRANPAVTLFQSDGTPCRCVCVMRVCM
jgi:hypothetical protein